MEEAGGESSTKKWRLEAEAEATREGPSQSSLLLREE